MVLEGERHLFFRCIFATFNNNDKVTITDMKKIFLMIVACAIIGTAVSCSDNDEPKRGDGVFTVNTSMVNHMVNSGSGTVIGISTTHNLLTLDTVKHTASVELNYNDGTGEKQLKLEGLTATPKRLGFYELSSPNYRSFSGYVDFNEGSIRYRYTTMGGMRVISVTPEVFFLKTANTVTYDDTTKATSIENVMYQFDIAPASNTAIVKVMGILHAKDMKYFNSITAAGVPYTVTTNGFAIDAENLKTNALYIAHVDSTGHMDGPVSSTDKYPFKKFKATIDLTNDHLEADYMMGGSATVTATGKTYPNYGGQ